MSSLKISLGSLFSLAFLLIAYLIAVKHSENNDLEREIEKQRVEQTLKGLLRTEREISLTQNKRVAIGFGSCRDIFVPSSDVLLLEKPPKFPEHFDTIKSKEELLKVFAYFFQHGAAAERYVSNTSMFTEIVATAQAIPEAHSHVGGNAAVMATRFAADGWKVLLGSQMSPELQSKLPPSISISGPHVTHDDIHLLLEYPAGVKWGTYQAPRANRFIIHSDHQNPLLVSLENFKEKLEQFNPHLLVIGGLQMMDNFPLPPSVRRARLNLVRDILKQQQKTPVHFEMASFTDTELLADLVSSILPLVDSLGMNEQELPNLHDLVSYGNISIVAESRPRVATVLDQMRELFLSLDKNAEAHQSEKKLSRLHVHTLAFQAILVRDRQLKWKHSKAAAAKAALMAHRHTCGSNEINPNKARLLMDGSFTTSQDPRKATKIPFRVDDPVTCWDEDDGLHFCLSPVLVCTSIVQTGGGGDNVSSAGLVLQI